MNTGKGSVYRGKGFILRCASKEFIENNNVKTHSLHQKNIFVESKKNNIFNKYNPVVLPLISRNLNKNRKSEIENDDNDKDNNDKDNNGKDNSDIRKKNKKGVKNINILNESEINSFLLRNKAFRLTWSCIIKAVKKEIDIQVSKNLSNVFEEIYLYSISNNKYLPLILMTAGTNVEDHEIIIDTLSYELKKWNYNKKGNRDNSNNDPSDGYIGQNNYEQINYNDNSMRREKNKFDFYKNEENDDNNEKDSYVCLLNSSTSNSVNSAICNIYNQLYKEYNMRLLMKIQSGSRKRNIRTKSYNNIDDIKKKMKLNSFNCGIYSNSFDEKMGEHIDEKMGEHIDEKMGEHIDEKMGENIDKKMDKKNGNDLEKSVSNCFLNLNNTFEEDCKFNKKSINLDQIVELYKNMSQLYMNKNISQNLSNMDEYKKEGGSGTSFGEYNGNMGFSSKKKMSFLLEELEKNNKKEVIEMNDLELELYNKQNSYFADGRKKVRIIILIHDCEYFNINVLNGILNMLINLRIDNKICLSVVLCVSTPSFFFNRITTPDTQSKLRIKTIDILNNKIVCENICDSLLYQNIIPFMLSFRTMYAIKLLLYKNNQSISHLVHILYILTKEFYDNNLFSFLSLPMDYYFNLINSDNTILNELNQHDEHDQYNQQSDRINNGDISGNTLNRQTTEYSPYTYVRSNQKSFVNYIKYDISILHKKIIALCYSSNLYYAHMHYLKKKYSTILLKNYYQIHGDNSVVHTPGNSDNELEVFTLKKKKKEKKGDNDGGCGGSGGSGGSGGGHGSGHGEVLDTHQNNENNNKKEEINSQCSYISNVDKSNMQKDEVIREDDERCNGGSNNNNSNNNSSSSSNNNNNNNSSSNNNNNNNNNKEEEKEGGFNDNTSENNDEIKLLKEENEITFDRNEYAWQFKANTINWWYDHPFRDLIYSYDTLKKEDVLKKENALKKSLSKKLNSNKIKHVIRESVKGVSDEKEEEEEKENMYEENTYKSRNLYDVENVKEINKDICEVSLPICVLQLIERKYAFLIAINLINIIISKCKSEYTNNSLKKNEFFKNLFECSEKIKWSDMENIVFIEEMYKIVENEVKKCINFLIDCISPYYFKNEKILYEILLEFKIYFSNIYVIVYNLEDYLYLLKEKEYKKNTKNFINDDFLKNINYSFSYSIYYSMLSKLDDIIEMFRKFMENKKNNIYTDTSIETGDTTTNKMYSKINDNTMTNTSSFMKKKNDKFNVYNNYNTESNGENSAFEFDRTSGSGKQNDNDNNDNNIHLVDKEENNSNSNTYNNMQDNTDISIDITKRIVRRYLTIENYSLIDKNKDNEIERGEKLITVEVLSNNLNLFIHDYLYLLLLPPVHYHPLAHELIIHKPSRDFTEAMTRDIKTELLEMLCYTNPYRTGSLMCQCCLLPRNLSNSNKSTNIINQNKIFLNPYLDNISKLEDLVNMYRIYERCNKTIELYNFFIFFINIKIDKFMGYSIEKKKNIITKEEEKKNQPGLKKNKKMEETAKNEVTTKQGEIINDENQNNKELCTQILQEYYLKFIIALNTFCSFLKILKPPNVSALLNYADDDDDEYLSGDDYYDRKDDTRDSKNNVDTEEISVGKLLIDIKKSLQGCTSKKLLFGKLYYNQTIVSRELLLQKFLEYNLDNTNDTQP
ncbi:conserved protein, unknown function [Hepatocystis sp. ex Piliocolobus tephrosceles]|nr:conserved protein, unknown function [Hepatocystis sp. ex Piliocolobus tephrosceles]